MMNQLQDPIPSTEDQADLVDLLHSRGQRVTSQRLVILRELRRRHQHATAEEVHRAVQHELPGVSVPTIYATLDLFVELGLARRIDTATAALYDAGLESHQHAVCRHCGKVIDVEGRLNAAALLSAAREAGFQAQGAELIITGLCAECAAGASG
jgi:Fur family ferric uptake transcriptional regulator/Fur family peroxide stress response transcriptional regulator